MFLNALVERNPEFVQAAVQAHQAGLVPPNCYVLDLDTIEANTATLCQRAHALGLTVLPMTKQVGRQPHALDAIARGGAEGFVAVDMDCARAIHRGGHCLGHLGHLVQVARAQVREASDMEPLYWTVFSTNKASEAAAAAAAAGRTQRLMLRIFDDGDVFYPGHEGGITLPELPAALDYIDSLTGAELAGLTTFPALLFDPATETARITRNVETLARAADLCRSHRTAPQRLELNLPGTTSTSVLEMLADAGATQVEPGHGLTGTTPPHAVQELPERPAVLYLSEVAHIHQGAPYCFGGGLYVDPVFGPYEVRALVAHDPDEALSLDSSAPVAMPNPAAIDYYARVNTDPQRSVSEGATVIFGFRIQAFVTRAVVVGLKGVATEQAEIAGICYSSGIPIERHFRDEQL